MKIEKHSKPFRSPRDGSTAPASDVEVPPKEFALVPAVLARAFAKLDLERRARLLGRLLGSVGPLALVVVSGGVFARYLRNAGWPEVPISFEDAARATSSQVYELARYVEQSDPHLITGLLGALLRDGVTVTALGASVATVAIKRVSRRRGLRPGSSIKK